MSYTCNKNTWRLLSFQVGSNAVKRSKSQTPSVPTACRFSRTISLTCSTRDNCYCSGRVPALPCMDVFLRPSHKFGFQQIGLPRKYCKSNRVLLDCQALPRKRDERSI